MAKKKQVKTDEDTLYSNNICLPAKDNKISESRVQAQLASAPAPNDRRRSGYPHAFMNKGGLILRRQSTDSTSYYEYPVMQNGPGYDFDSKPKQNPGPYRGVVNQNKDYRATICHNGVVQNGENFPNLGDFHVCNKTK
ncbi:hypothetical protein KVR01_004639 [Diaporthe batatas]|uniref:uncharacterized protein n=1 Tax=Diaporthe batatas TaxID=748121 RepID=UPI001D0392F3|nr:uncharacterized protein KVR01_004639 [Diaporthe batatas]KAG8166087.1 hypothetical protein KVR01_004639 [Diaporthe batatas]